MCHYCFDPIIWKAHTSTKAINLDRKDNSLPHNKSNLVVCCGWCNSIKSDQLTYSEFILLSPILKEIRLRRNFKENLT
jgi:hypothetical protein